MNIKSVNKSNKIGCIILLAISFGILIAGIVIHAIHINRLENWIEQPAVVSKIDEVSEEVTYKYIYEGITYESEASMFFNISINLEDPVVIYLNPKNVEEIYVPAQMTVGVFFYIIAGTFAILVSSLIVLYKKKTKWNRKCLAEGKKVVVEVNSVKTIYGTSYNFTYLMVLTYNGKEYFSDAFRLDKGIVTKVKGTVNLYILNDSGSSFEEAELFLNKFIEDFKPFYDSIVEGDIDLSNIFQDILDLEDENIFEEVEDKEIDEDMFFETDSKDVC